MMQKNIKEIGKSYLEKIEQSQTYFTPRVEIDSTQKIRDLLEHPSEDTDDLALIKGFRQQRNIISTSYYLFIFSQANCFFVRKCDEFIKVAIKELNDKNSFLFRLPAELLLSIFSYLNIFQIEAIKATCAKFHVLGNNPNLKLFVPILNLRAQPKINDFETNELPSSSHEIVFISDKEIAYAPRFGNSGAITLVNINNPRVRATLNDHYGPIRSLTFNEKKKLLISGGSDKTIRIWDIVKRKCIQVLDAEGEVYCVDHYDNKIISGLDKGRIEIWDLTTNLSLTFVAHDSELGTNRVSIVMHCHTTGQLISYSLYQTIKIWDKTTLSCLATYRSQYPISSILVHPSVDIIIGACKFTNNLILFNAKTLKKIKEVSSYDNPKDSIKGMKLHTNGTLVTISAHGIFQERDINTFVLKSKYQLCFGDSASSSSSDIAMDVNRRNGQVIFAKYKKILNIKFPPLLSSSVEDSDQQNIKFIVNSLNSVFCDIDLGERQWCFNSKENAFWIRVESSEVLSLRKQLNRLGFVNRYETKKVIASDDRCVLIKINQSFSFNDLAQLLLHIENDCQSFELY